TISEENNPAALDKYQRFLLHVSRTYESRNEEEIVNLWREEERESERGSIDSLKEQSDWPQATGSFFTDQTKVLAIEETDFGVIVISERDNSRYALYLVENEKG